MKLLAAALLMTIPQVADAARVRSPTPCITRAEMEDLTLYLLPVVLPAIGDKCRTALPADSWLATDGVAYAARLAEGRDSHWAGTRGAFVKVAGEAPGEFSDDTLRRMVDDMLRAKLMPAIKPADCPRIDEAARLLAPLPPQNLGGLVALLAQIGAGKSDDFAICPASRP